MQASKQIEFYLKRSDTLDTKTIKPVLVAALSNVRRLERIEHAAEKMLRHLEQGSSHPVDTARLRQELDYPKRTLDAS